ncbi:MAG TPA: carbon storage regulator [Steroidobacteraceae bacterium]|nr:carbon storage regulator [Steroidobacteraceae bacterium]
MLVITRSIGESVNIGPDIRVTVIAIENRQVRLGIFAPPDLMNDRDEVHDRAQDETETVEVRDLSHINWR